MEKADVTIIGAGIIGLAISYLLSDTGKEIVVIEKNPSFGQETSSRNSEVIHGGIYYPPDSLKAKTCVRGRDLLYELCARRGIAHKKSGKLVLASGKDETAKLNDICNNALHCGVKNLRFLDKNAVKRLEPRVEAESALFSPDSGIVDSHGVMNLFFQSAKGKNANFVFSTEVMGIEKKKELYEIAVKEPNGEIFSFETKIVINSAGLWADKIAWLAGIDPDRYSYRIHYCKGEYFRIRNPKKFSIEHLIYPPPNETDLGIHVTPDLAGGLRLGPDARYVKDIDYTVREEDKPIFLDSVRKFLPDLELDDILSDTAGVRPKLQGEKDGFRDFVIEEENRKGFPGFVNLIGIESPGLTSSLAIAEMVKTKIDNLW